MKLKLFVVSLIGFLTMCAAPSLAKTWTVDQRQAQQMKDINAAQKSGDLTVKDSEKLRSELARVARKEAKLKLKRNGTLTPDDIAKMQKDLDALSAKIPHKQAKSSPAK
ncbi:MAG TPA: hypothetical protein V6C81_04690 [Planktothrix sp.]|jgi:hypothetical protein